MIDSKQLWAIPFTLNFKAWNIVLPDQMWIGEFCPDTAKNLIVAIFTQGQLSSIEYHAYLPFVQITNQF